MFVCVCDPLITTQLSRPYLIDLGSSNGTKLNGKSLEAARYYELVHGDVLVFGFSSREFVFVHDQDSDDDGKKSKRDRKKKKKHKKEKKQRRKLSDSDSDADST